MSYGSGAYGDIPYAGTNEAAAAGGGGGYPIIQHYYNALISGQSKMQKNTAGKWIVFAFQDQGGASPGEPVTGDAANITANIRIDGGAANAVDDTNPTELEDGYYVFDITAAEANGDLLLIAPQSGTANVNVVGVPGAVWTSPAGFNALTTESISDAVWDEVLTGAAHNVANSAGRRLRGLQEFQGYEQGSVWIDTVNGTAGTTTYENGTVENPVSTLADATTLATNAGLKSFHVINGSSLTLAQAYTNYDFYGQEWTLALGGQNISNAFFRNATQGVSGVGTGTTPFFEECSIGNVTLPPCAFDRCGFTGTLTIGSAGDFFLVDCFSRVAGASAPVLDMGAAVGATNVSIRRWSGGITINNLAAGDVLTLEGIFGTITLNGADAQVEIRGIAKAVVNNLTGSPTVNDDSVKADTITGLNNISVNDVLTTQMTESYAANGVAPSLTQAIMAIHQMLMQFSISGTTNTIKKLDNTTTAFTATLNDATSPTGVSRT